MHACLFPFLANLEHFEFTVIDMKRWIDIIYPLVFSSTTSLRFAAVLQIQKKKLFVTYDTSFFEVCDFVFESVPIVIAGKVKSKIVYLLKIDDYFFNFNG